MGLENLRSLSRERDKAPDETEGCWKELLDRAFTGLTPADQALEYLIDRVEKQR